MRRMRTLLCLVPWMAMTAAAAGQEDVPRPAELAFTHYDVAPALRLGDECFVAPSLLNTWGWPYSLVQNEATIQAEGRVVRVSAKTFENKIYIPLKPALEQLGAGFKWDKDKLQVWGVARFITYKNGRLTLDSTLAGKPVISTMENPNRIVVDFKGIRMGGGTRAQVSADVRTAQYSEDTLRVTIQTDKVPGYQADLEKPTREFALALVEKGGDATRVFNPDRTGGLVNGTTRTPATKNPEPDIQVMTTDDVVKQPVTQSSPPVKAGTPVEVQPLEIVSDTSKGAKFRIAYSKAPVVAPTFKRLDPTTIELTVPNAKYGADANRSYGDSIRSVDVREENGGVVFSIKLSRAMGAEFSTTAKDLQLNLFKPNVGDGKLAGKVVVVDPGHGGHDTGCQSPGKDLLEKHVALKLGMAISEQLAAEGATVIMTRKTDVFIKLPERSAIANRNNADFFVSVHVDSNKAANSRSGGTVYYHGGSANGQLMAECIEIEIKKNGKIPSLGPRSDKKLYSTGLAVLRNSKMPAVLIETGFMNHSNDRKALQTDGYRTSLSKAVVKGLKMYLGDGKVEE